MSTPGSRSALRLAVALCAYNGAAYLRAQLESILRQARQPDHVVLLDDASTDGTAEVLRDFALGAPFPVRVEVHPRNVGYVKSFEHAIELTEGDVVVLADQDDVWRSDKLERMEATFASEPDVGLVFSDAEVVDADLRPLGFRLWTGVGLTPARQEAVRRGRAFETLVRASLVTGATMAFRRGFMDLVLPIGVEVDHDSWIALLISAVAQLRALPEPLIQYRQHASNQIGVKKLGWRARLRAAHRQRTDGIARRLQQHERALARLEHWPGVSAARLAVLHQAVRHLRCRAALPQPRLSRLGPVVAELARGGYHFSAGLPSAVRDLVA